MNRKDLDVKLYHTQQASITAKGRLQVKYQELCLQDRFRQHLSLAH